LPLHAMTETQKCQQFLSSEYTTDVSVCRGEFDAAGVTSGTGG